jgi:hypothetical protein
VIVVGLHRRLSTSNGLSNIDQLLKTAIYKATASDVLRGMPRLRSGLSRHDSTSNWGFEMSRAVRTVRKAAAYLPAEKRTAFLDLLEECERLPAKESDVLHREGRTPLALISTAPHRSEIGSRTSG